MRPHPLPFVALTPASCGAVLTRRLGTLWATTILKATLRLVPSGLAELTDPDEIVYEDRRAKSGSLEAGDEAVAYLPDASVVLLGSAFAPQGHVTRSVAVRLGVSRQDKLIDKTLHVYGDRADPHAAARPFQRLPITYERAYGGPSIAENPVGVGAMRGSGLPNVIHPEDARRPAGFGPIAKDWAPRAGMFAAAGIDARALDADTPSLPAAFDGWCWSSAPLDQRVATLTGEEWIVLDGMHPELARVETRLPRVTARAEWQAASGPAHAIDLRADMLVIDADRMVCSLVWRGCFVVPRAGALAQVRVVGGVEASGSSRAPLIPSPPEPRMTAPAMTMKLPEPRDLATTQDADSTAARPSLPFASPVPGRSSPASIVGPPAAPVRKDLSETSRLDLHRLLQDIMPFSSPPPEPRAEPTPPPPPLLCAPMPQAVEVPAEEADDDEEIVDVRSEVVRRLAQGESLLGLDLAGADLHGLDFTGRILSGLDMRGADLRDARLRDVRLTGVDLTRADLTGADLTSAELARAHMAHATVARACFDGAVLSNANLTGVHGEGASFVTAAMRRAALRGAALPHAKFEGADLRGADLDGTVLDEGALDAARVGRSARRDPRRS